MDHPEAQVGSDLWWAQQLRRRTRQRAEGSDWRLSRRMEMELSPSLVRPGLDMLWAYLRGEPPLPHHIADWGPEMYPFLRLSRMNFAEICIGSVVDRIIPVGYHTSVDNDPDGDQIAAELAAVNNLDEKIPDLSERGLTLGESYFFVGEVDPETGYPNITVEDPRNTIVVTDPLTDRPKLGYKERLDEWTGGRRGFLYGVENGVTWFREAVFDHTNRERFLGDRIALPAHGGRLPLVPFRNKGGIGDFESHLDPLDRINDGIFTRVTIAKAQAFRQRAFEGLPEYDEMGEPIDYRGVFTASPGAAWQLPEGSKVWESSYVDLGPIRLAIKSDVEEFFSVTRTPLHYVAPEAAQGSAEGASAQREAHVYRAKDRRRRVAATLRNTLSLAFTVMGDHERARPIGISTIWEPMEWYSLSSKSNAFAQMKDAFPFEALATDILQYPPAELPRLLQQRDGDLLMQTPTPPLTPSAPPTQAAAKPNPASVPGDGGENE